ncbi:tandem-95 repeat protein [Spongiibacter nanhainus]|uniref:Tandem-95 repeat protein n=1 Tax=Spongiibacter nanhainus TaxID=2794344 RepID=A0A7T4R0C2_9GAMM|nr:tandem-95 repeat protein [Spongiibacter nanhainus]QQD18086.1 tandem-95 repeat protein [Spongiibacter nanhainus]
MIDLSNYSFADLVGGTLQPASLKGDFPAELLSVNLVDLNLPEQWVDWLDKERRKEEAENDADVKLDTSGAVVDIAAVDFDALSLTAVDTHQQAAVSPPESSGSEEGFSINPLVWTVAGVAGIVALDSADSDSNGGGGGNRAPVFAESSRSLTIQEDQPIIIRADVTDKDGDELTFSIPSSARPDNGTVEEGGSPGVFVYTPDAEFSGEDSFTIRVSDGNGGIAVQEVTITVENVNDAPEVDEEQNISGNQGQVLRITVPATDIEGDPLTYTFTNPSNGSLTPGDSPGEYFYAPDAAFTGEDSFTVTVSDGTNDVSQTINLRVGLPNEAPDVDETQTVIVDEDEEITVTVEAEDVDGDTLTYTAGDPSNGTVEEGDNPGEFVYTPDPNFNGEDSFTVTVDDGNGGTATQTITVMVNPVEDTYELSADDVEAAEGDTDGNTMVFELKLDRAPFDEDVVINVVSQDGTATAGDDFEAVDTQLTFLAGEDTVELTVNLLGDTIVGIDEAFTLLISGELLAEDVTVTGTILNDDLDPNWDAPTIDLLAELDTGELDDDNITSEDDLGFRVIAEPGVDIEIFQDGVSIGTATEDSDGVYLFEVDNLGDGEYEFVAILSVNGSSDTLESQPLTVTVDSEDPSTPTIALAPESDTGAIGDRLTADDTPTLVIAAEAGASVEVFLDGESLGLATENEAGQYSFTASALGEGNYEFSAVATDPAGNSSSASADLDIEIDTTAPAAPVIALDAGSDSGVSGEDGITQNDVLFFTIDADPGSTVEVFQNGTSVGIAQEDGNNPGQYDFTTSTLDEGNFQLTAEATDLAGNTSALSLSEDVTIDTSAPVIAALTADAEADTVTVSFDESLGLFDDADFSFTVNELAAAVTGVNAADDSLTFSLDVDLQAGDTIDVALLAGAIADIAGNGIAAVDFNDDPAGTVV